MVTALLTNDMNVCLVLQYAGTVCTRNSTDRMSTVARYYNQRQIVEKFQSFTI